MGRRGSAGRPGQAGKPARGRIVLEDAFAYRFSQLPADFAQLSGDLFAIFRFDRLAGLLDESSDPGFHFLVRRSSFNALPVPFDSRWMNSQ